MQIWQSISRTPSDQLVPVARLAESLGFGGLTMSDHVVRPLAVRSSYPYSADGSMGSDTGTPYLDPWLLSSHLARVTQQLRFMPYVYIPALRDPASVAKAVSTAAILSQDRVLMGIGVGWMEEEFELMGRAFRQRGRRTDELIEVVRKLVSGEMVEHHGEFYDWGPVQMAPVPACMPPVLVGGHSPVALRRAAAADGWVGVNYDLEAVFPMLDSLREQRRALGLASRPFDAALALNAPPSQDDLRRLEEAGVTILVNPPLLGPGGEPTSLDAKRSRLEALAERTIQKLGH